MRHRHGAWLVALAAVASLDAAGNSVKLVDAVKQGNRAAVRTLITERANVNAAEPDGMTPLHWAVRGDDLQHGVVEAPVARIGFEQREAACILRPHPGKRPLALDLFKPQKGIGNSHEPGIPDGLRDVCQTA